jgi:hypothetical protein
MLMTIDADWLTGALKSTEPDAAPVVDLTVEEIASGAWCSLARVTPKYGAGRPGPSTLVAKVPRTEPAAVQLAEAMGILRRERAFYAELAPQVKIGVPRCFYSAGHERDPLLLEDLSALRVGDQVTGFSAAEVGLVIDRLAALHAQFWAGRGGDLAAHRWLIQPGDEVMTAVFCGAIASGLPTFLERYAKTLPAAAVTATERMCADFATVVQRCAEGPLTLVHGDARAENWLFDDAGSIDSADATLIDWQAPGHARGTQDVAYVLSGSVSLPDQRHAADLLRRYYDGLRSHGVDGYDWSDCQRHYRQHVLFSFYAAFALLGGLAHDEKLLTLADHLVERNVRHAYDIEAFDSI